jgi:colanic acid/amylovoran biosynthesis protein
VRERLTQEYMAEAFKLGPDRAVLTADVAFLLEPSPAERADAILAHLGLETGKFVAMSASQGITTFSTLGGDDAHDRAWIEAIETVLKTTDHSVLIVPHVQAPQPANNDARIAFRLLEKLNFHPRVKAAFGPYTASDFKALIARSRFLIGERMHACIAALSSGVPLITVGYSIKARGIMGDVFGAKAEEYGLIVPVKDFLEPGKIAGMIRSVEDNFEPIRATLTAELPRVKERARDNFTRLAALAGQKGR